MNPGRLVGNMYVERFDRRADALARQVDLIGKGFMVRIEWEPRKLRWRLVYWQETEQEAETL